VKPWEKLATASMPDGGCLELYRHDRDYVIRVDGVELMTSRMHASEDAMLALACPKPPPDARVLVGGLGMGYTLAAALVMLPPRAAVTVAELIPEVVEWNRGPLAPLANHPLDDPRTETVVGDVGEVIRKSNNRFDAILLDVDNGPDALVDRGNSGLYTQAGLAAAHRALRSGGALAVWSLAGEPSFERRLRAAGLVPSTHRVAAHGGRGARHMVFVGRKA
jgi:spermidine synthase